MYTIEEVLAIYKDRCNDKFDPAVLAQTIKDFPTRYADLQVYASKQLSRDVQKEYQ